MEGHPQKETVLRLVCGGILWGISSLLTASLFLTLAGNDPLRQAILLLLAVGLEGAKILSWRMGTKERVLSVSLIVLSGLGSLGAALQTVQTYRQSHSLVQHQQSPMEARVLQDLNDLDRQQTILLDRLERLPPDFITATKDLNGELERLRVKRSELSVQLSQSEDQSSSTASPASVFDLMAQVLGLPTETLMLILLLFLAVNLEVAALVLAGHVEEPKPDSALAVSAEAFLEAAMKGAPLPVLHGRDATAQKLGISFYEAKKIVAFLKAEGTNRAVGKRLVLCLK